MNSTNKKLILLGGLVLLGAAPFLSFRTFTGNPRWPLSGGFHYVADLHPVSFPTTTNQGWWRQARKSLSDWWSTSVGGTTYTPGHRSIARNASNHGDGNNAWIWTNQPSQSWLGITFVRFSGSTMRDCDIWYNSRPDYPWSQMRFNPCPSSSSRPFNFRGVARHEHGHALGLNHESRELNSMHQFSFNGTHMAHQAASSLGGNNEDFSFTGMLPHCDDKQGLRFLYPRSLTARNVMATNHEINNAATSGGSVVQRRLAGTFSCGQRVTIPLATLQNQSNVTLPGGSSGIRVGVYLSTNSIISQLDQRVAQFTFGGNFGAHAQGEYGGIGGGPNLGALSFVVPDLGNTSNVTRFVGVCFDDTNVVAEGPRSRFETSSGYGADNCCELGLITIRPCPRPDLRPTSLTTPANLVQGQVGTWRSTIRNLGTASAPSNTSGYYLSVDSTCTTSDTLLFSFTTVALPVNGTHNHAAGVRIPSNARLGICYAAVIADRLGRVTESSETNNTLCLRRTCVDDRPDLVIAFLGSSTTTLVPNTLISVTSLTRNAGFVTAGASTTAHVLSADATITSADVLLGTAAIPSLAPSGSVTVRLNHVVPWCRMPATCYIGAIADVAGTIFELSEANNTRALRVACRAPSFSLRLIQWQGRYPNITSTSATFDASTGGSGTICIAAPRFPNHFYMLVWSGSSGPFIPDALTNLSLSLLNNPAIFPRWFGRVDAAGMATAGFGLPRGLGAIRLTAYVHHLWFTPTLSRVIGFGDNRIRHIIVP